MTPRVATSDGLRVERRMIDHRRLKRLDRRMASMRLKAVASRRARWAPTGDGPARLEWEGGIPSVRYRDFRAQYGREWERITEADHQHCHRLTTAIIQSLDPGPGRRTPATSTPERSGRRPRPGDSAPAGGRRGVQRPRRCGSPARPGRRWPRRRRGSFRASGTRRPRLLVAGRRETWRSRPVGATTGDAPVLVEAVVPVVDGVLQKAVPGDPAALFRPPELGPYLRREPVQEVEEGGRVPAKERARQGQRLPAGVGEDSRCDALGASPALV